MFIKHILKILRNSKKFEDDKKITEFLKQKEIQKKLKSILKSSIEKGKVFY